jgi:hypothetical protein
VFGQHVRVSLPRALPRDAAAVRVSWSSLYTRLLRGGLAARGVHAARTHAVHAACAVTCPCSAPPAPGLSRARRVCTGWRHTTANYVQV